MAAVWEPHKDRLRTLFVVKGETLKSIIAHMREFHEFDKNKGQYERQFKTWGFRKNSTAKCWSIVNRKVELRRSQGRSSLVRREGKEVSQARLIKERGRVTSGAFEFTRSELPQTPEGFSVCTPPCNTAQSIFINNLPSLKLYSLLSSQIDSNNILFSLSNHDLFSRTATEGTTWRAPPSAQCFDWVHSLADDRHPNLDIVSGSTTFEIDIPSELSSVSRADDHSRLLCSIVHSAANNLLSLSQASKMLPMILQNSNLKLFQALIAGSSPATKAIARTFLPSAIDSLDFSLVSALLDTGISPNCCVDVSRRRPLQIALLRKSIEMTQLLLDRGADVNLSFPMSSSVDADTPLKVAVEIGRLDLVQLLLRAGAHVNDPEAGHTPSALQIASRAGHIDLMQLLLVAGADVHARVTYGSTALQAAAGAGNIAVVRLLLSHGADVHAASEEHGLTALESAARSDNVEITQLLISHGATGIVTAIDVAGNSRSNRVVNHLVNSRMRLHATLDDTFGKVALRAATKCADFGLVQKLLECGVCANAPPTAGETNSETLPQIAARHGNTRIAELLISYGADVNAPPDAPLAVSFCVTAFQEAVRESHMHLVQRFLYRGANVNAPAAPGSETALAAAAHLSGMKIFRLLVDHCADMKTQAASVLIDSIGHVSLEVLRFLLDTWTLACGGNLDCNHWTASRDGQTALEIAAECDDVELIRLLLEHEAGDKSLALRGAVLGGSSMEIMELLLVSGAVVGCLDDDHRQNMTALQEAARDIRPDVLRLLLEHRSHQTAAYEKSRALQMSALESNFDAARLLLDHGADVNAAPSPLNYGDDGTKTALQAAAGKGDLKMVRFLLEAGADVESKVLSEDEEGTALQFAAIAGSMSVVTTLVQAGADVNAPVICGWGRTAIEGAAEHGRLDIVQFLLDLGVEASGSRAMQLARKEGHDGVVALLEEGGWEVDE